jgi:hypothetical protein
MLLNRIFGDKTQYLIILLLVILTASSLTIYQSLVNNNNNIYGSDAKDQEIRNNYRSNPYESNNSIIPVLNQHTIKDYLFNEISVKTQIFYLKGNIPHLIE